MTTASAAPWTRAYRPLRRRGLLVALAIVVVAEVLLFASYNGHEAPFHWATHFLVGLIAAAVVNLVWLALKGAPARGQLLSILGLHLYAMAPDLLFSGAKLPHDGWMNVFLGHISVHYVPGGTRSWLALALVASGTYAWVLSRWLRARHLEAAAGMAPGIGLSGDALLRPQLAPTLATLAHHEPAQGDTPQILLLHGLGGSRRLWDPVRERLGAQGVAALVPDLLGFGASRSIGTTFGLDDHVTALLRLLDETRVRTVVVAGHSFGCAVAVALARRAPERVSGLVLVAPPVFRDAAQARERLGQRDWLSRQVVNNSPAASLACSVMCLLRRPVAVAVARASRQLPNGVARDGVQHSWPAYRDALYALLDDNPLPAWISSPGRPTTVVLSDQDREAPARDVLDFPHDTVNVVQLQSDHLTPLTNAYALAQVIAVQLTAERHAGS